MMHLSFEEWYEELMVLAKRKGMEWLVSNDHEDHREAYEDGDTVEEEIQNQIDCAT